MRVRAARIAAISSLVRSSTASASSNHASVVRWGAAGNRASASKPTSMLRRRSTIGWNTTWTPSLRTPRTRSNCRRTMLELAAFDVQAAGELTDHVRGHAGRQRALSGRGAVDRVGDVVARPALDHVADRSGAEHGEDALAVFVRGEPDHGRSRRARADAGCGLGATAPHAHVDQDHVRAVHRGELDGAVGVLHHADHLDRRSLDRTLVTARAISGWSSAISTRMRPAPRARRAG